MEIETNSRHLLDFVKSVVIKILNLVNSCIALSELGAPFACLMFTVIKLKILELWSDLSNLEDGLNNVTGGNGGGNGGGVGGGDGGGGDNVDGDYGDEGDNGNASDDIGGDIRGFNGESNDSEEDPRNGDHRDHDPSGRFNLDSPNMEVNGIKLNLLSLPAGRHDRDSGRDLNDSGLDDSLVGVLTDSSVPKSVQLRSYNLNSTLPEMTASLRASGFAWSTLQVRKKQSALEQALEHITI